MDETIDYYWVPQSPWTWLGHDRLVALAQRHGAAVRFMPFDLGRVFGASGGLPLGKRAPQRQAYRLVEMARWRDALGVPLNLQPRFFPVAGDDAARLAIVALQRHGTGAALRLAGALNRAVWADERDIADAATLAAIADECALPGAELMGLLADAQADYDVNTERALAAQVFGAPWYVLRDEPFWGQDRLDFLERALAQDAPR